MIQFRGFWIAPALTRTLSLSFVGGTIADRTELGNLIFSIALEMAARLDVEVGPRLSSTTAQARMNGFKFFQGNKRLLEEKLRNIPGTKGFRFTPSLLTGTTGWRDYFDTGPVMWDPGCTGKTSLIKPPFRYTERHDGTYDNCGHSSMYVLPELGAAAPFCPHCGVEMCVTTLPYVAAVLSFTDWGAGFRKLSAEALFGGCASTTREYLLGQLVTYREDRSLGDTLTGHSAHVDAEFEGPAILKALVSEICCPDESLHLLEGQKDGLVGIELDGVLLIEKLGVDTSLRHGMSRFQLHEGMFALNGDRRYVVLDRHRWNGSLNTKKGDEPMGDFIDPWRGCSSSPPIISVSAQLSPKGIELSYSVISRICHAVSSTFRDSSRTSTPRRSPESAYTTQGLRSR
ncbi:hypothetical protein QBC34DRAFT_386309 [Podospora aff. communis PSN243]|uniref:Uncharacterized protein n=1 Tax=Podospora aff. communis PSN243 TaxID=3040156 RepID=A0AAV9G7R6_9PEZI|nr:hypothetical protein QBC34DRAFT_386309 [Podospora aff. communis PSN243]